VKSLWHQSQARFVTFHLKYFFQKMTSRDCAINCDHLQTVSRGKIGALITTTFLWLQQYDEGLLKEPGGFPGGSLPTVESKAAHLLYFVVKNHIPGVPTAVMRPTTPCKRECILSQWKI
jgi:hypothetical protein